MVHCLCLRKKKLVGIWDSLNRFFNNLSILCFSEDTKGIPSFWLTVFKNVDMLSEMVQVSCFLKLKQRLKVLLININSKVIIYSFYMKTIRSVYKAELPNDGPILSWLPQ